MENQTDTQPEFYITNSIVNGRWRIYIDCEGYRNFTCETGFDSCEDAKYALEQNKGHYLKRWEANKSAYKY